MFKLLDHKIHWDSNSSFESLPFHKKYYFLYTLILHLKLFNKKHSDDLYNGKLSIFKYLLCFMYDSKENTLLKKQIAEFQLGKKDGQIAREFENEFKDKFSKILAPDNHDWADLNSVINYAITYLEKYCVYDKILMDIRFNFEGFTYGEFQDLKPTKLRTRLIELIINNIKSLSDNTILVEINDFDEFKPEINHQSTFNSIKESVPDIIRKIKSTKNSSYITLLLEPKPYNNQSEYIDTTLDRIKLGDSQKLENGISFDSFSVDGGNEADYIVVDDEGSDNYSTPTMPQKVGLFHLEKTIDHFHNIVEGLIKLSVLNELENTLKTSPRYKPPIFTVKGPSEAIDEYSSWFIKHYNLKRPVELAKKLEEFCYEETESGKPKRMKRNSITRIIRRRKIF